MISKLLSAVLLCCVALPAFGETYKPGSAIKPFSAKDQFGRDYTFRKGTKFLLVSFDMETGKAANQDLAALGGKYLQDKGAVYLSNIHGMPGIARVFAFNKMKKYPHAIVLCDDANLLTPYPKQVGKVTVLKLDGAAKITGIKYWTPGAEKLDSLLK